MVTTHENFLTAEECDKIIAMIDANHYRSGVADENSTSGTISDVRTSSTTNLGNDDKTIIAIKQRIADHLGLDVNKGESLQGQLYKPGQYFKPHTDYFEGTTYNTNCLSSGNRTHTLMIYLNDDMEGGHTNFPRLGLSIKPQKGMAVVWENMKDGQTVPDVLHEGSAVESGSKYIVTSWWRQNEWDNAKDVEAHKKFLAAKTEAKTFTNPADLPRLTTTGFKVVKCPDRAWNVIKEAYDLLKHTKTEEKFDGKENVIIGDGNTSDLLSLDQVPTIRDIIHDELKPLHEEWCGEALEKTYVYGIRSYNKGATLIRHVDRIATHHISAIVIVDKDLDCGCRQTKGAANDWPLEIEDHKGEVHKIYAEIGDIILYESAICKHGREEEFKGNWFRNFYVHYKLKDWTYVG